MLNPGWYILNYHDISGEENPYLVGIGGTFPPDIFREHLAALSQAGELVSVQEGFRRWQEGDIDVPLFSFWFDDGIAGVRKYAMPLMDQYGIQGAVSINSRFTLRREMFWRLKLSYLSQVDGLRFLRSWLKPFGYILGQSIKAFVMDHFSLEIVEQIDAIYRQFTRKLDREDAFRIFDTIEGVEILQRNGWEIANHSSAHYPLSEASHIDHFAEEFHECEEVLEKYLGAKTNFWVLPFDRKSLEIDNLLTYFHQADDASRHLVLVGDKINTTYDPGKKIIYRIEVPYLDGGGLVKYLRSMVDNNSL